MRTDTAYQKVFINGLGSRVKLRLLSPSEMEALESMPESERESEFILQGLYDPGEMMRQLCNALGSDLINVMVSNAQEPFAEKLQQIKIDLVEAICRINELANLKFLGNEVLETGLGQCHIRVAPDGRILISPMDDQCMGSSDCNGNCEDC